MMSTTPRPRAWSGDLLPPDLPAAAGSPRCCCARVTQQLWPGQHGAARKGASRRRRAIRGFGRCRGGVGLLRLFAHVWCLGAARGGGMHGGLRQPSALLSVLRCAWAASMSSAGMDAACMLEGWAAEASILSHDLWARSRMRLPRPAPVPLMIATHVSHASSTCWACSDVSACAASVLSPPTQLGPLALRLQGGLGHSRRLPCSPPA